MTQGKGAEREHEAREHRVVDRRVEVEARLGGVELVFVAAERTASGGEHLAPEARNVDHHRVVERVEVDQLVEGAVHRGETGGLPAAATSDSSVVVTAPPTLT